MASSLRAQRSNPGAASRGPWIASSQGLLAMTGLTPTMLGAVIDSAERRKAELERLRPLSTAALAQLQKHYDVELTYTSNAIEGNTLTLRETAEVIEHGITVGGKKLKEHLEAVDHYEAVLWMRDLAAETAPIGENVVRELHR